MVRSGRFCDLPNLVFIFPPMNFSTHAMDQGEWTLRIKQKHSLSRPRISMINEDGFGLRIRIKAQMYMTLEDIFLAVQEGYVVEQSDTQTYKTVPRKETIYRERDITESLMLDNAARLKSLGDWRPTQVVTIPENVVRIEDYINKIETTPAREINFDVDYVEALETLARQG